jgi:hypothetical protein
VLAYGDSDAIEYMRTAHAADINSGRLVVYRYDNGGAPFHLSKAKNMAARCGILEGAKILVTQDADNYTGASFAQFIAESFHEPGIRPGIFLCPNYQHIKSLPHGALRPARGYAGRLAIWSQTFIKLGGYCESFDTWRGEDIHMVQRLQRMGYSMRFIPNEYLHALNHNAEVRFKEYPHAQAAFENGNQVDIIKERTDTVCNYGRFGMGTVYRNFDSMPIELGQVPTRIFAIGMQRTGTTSLDEAFKILGLDSLHWGTGEAQLIWQEMNALGQSPTLEQFYALSDNPLPLLYRKLDEVYKNSKFILTIRDEVEWLASVKRLWDPRYNKNIRFWKAYPITNQIHTALYGQPHFDPLVFLERYRRHNQGVRDYFKDRPDDLLVIDLDKPRGKMAALCKFLGLPPMPDGSYPRANRSREIVVATS